MCTNLSASIPAASQFSGTTNYSYDYKSRLLQEQSSRAGSYVNNFTYDGAGNPTLFKGQSVSYNSDNQNSAVAYDGTGNPASNRGAQLAFDAENRLTAYGSTLTAGYRADGLRAWKQSALGRSYFLYDGQQPVCEVGSTGNVSAVTTFGVYGVVSRTAQHSTNYLFDPMGNIAQQKDANSGQVQSSYLCDSYGTRAYANPTGDSSYQADPYSGFGGQWGYFTDAETGLSLLGHRYYDASTGQFLTRDPIGYKGGSNVYAYCESNPVSRIDPKGDASIIRVGPWLLPSHFYITWNHPCGPLAANPASPHFSMGFWPADGRDIPGVLFPGKGQLKIPDDHDGEGDPVMTNNDPAFEERLCRCILAKLRQPTPSYGFAFYKCSDYVGELWSCADGTIPNVSYGVSPH